MTVKQPNKPQPAPANKAPGPVKAPQQQPTVPGKAPVKAPCK
jgi:hypothetical protein